MGSRVKQQTLIGASSELGIDFGSSNLRRMAVSFNAAEVCRVSVSLSLSILSLPLVTVLRSNSSVVISDGPFIAPEHTARLGRCTWVFHSTMQISVQFTELDMEKGYDFVKVYEGASSDSLLL